SLLSVVFFLLYSSPTTAIYTLSLHDALPISSWPGHFIDRNRPRFPARPSSGRPGGAPHHGRPGAPSSGCTGPTVRTAVRAPRARSEEHTSELQSRVDLVCRLLLEKKKKKICE